MSMNTLPIKLPATLQVDFSPTTTRLRVGIVVAHPSGHETMLEMDEDWIGVLLGLGLLQVAAPARTVPPQQPPPNESEHTMSWSISAKGANKDEALQHFNTAVEANTYAPQEGRLQQAAAELAKYAANDAGTYEVASSGHLEPDGHGYATVRVESTRPTPKTDTPAA